MYTTAQKHKTECEMKNMDTPDRTLVFGGYEVKEDCPLRTRRRLAGLPQNSDHYWLNIHHIEANVPTPG